MFFLYARIGVTPALFLVFSHGREHPNVNCGIKCKQWFGRETSRK